MGTESITDDDVADLVRRCQDAAVAFINGDMRTYLGLFGHAEDYTLMAPYGGAPRHGFDSSDDAVNRLAQFFAGGDAEVKLTATYTSGDLAVLALIERQHGEVGGLPDQDWSLRVTVVFRRESEGWQLVHRHADPLVRDLGFQRTAEIARGSGGSG
jgi:ketosteroid isomerase-like protein